MSSSPSGRRKLSASASLWIRLGCLLLIGGYAVFVAAYHYIYQDRLFPGLHFAGQDVSELSSTAFEARFPQWQEQKTSALAKELQFTVQGKAVKLNTRDLIIGEAPNAWAQLYTVGRKPSDLFFYAPFLLRTGLVPSTKTALSLRLNTQLASQRLQEAVASQEKATTDARFVIAGTDPQDAQRPLLVDVSQAERGYRFAIDEAVKQMQTAIQGQTGSYHIALAKIEGSAPNQTREDLLPLLPQAQSWVDHAPVTLKDEEAHTWTLSKADIAHWLSTGATVTQKSLHLQSPVGIHDLEERTRPLWREAKDGSLTMNGNTLVSLEAPQDGWRLDSTSTLAEIELSLQSNSSTAIAKFTLIPGQLQGEAAERLGIRESLGSGHSAFPGSPANRRKNIALGATKVHGTLIAPGGEFSLLKTLGEIDGEHGWLPELVIKGNKTTPEFGGGLCQIGTTVFRGATNVGMPITERQNHSYRVAYYEPAGTDATIYSPAPDFKFKNDTEHWILITKRMGKDEVWFDFWGTKDGRSIYKSTPKIFNIVQPPPQKNIETTDLPVGKTKCTEKAHAGASASFDYQVTYASGELKKVTFNSYYKPWQAVCLVGVAQLTAAETSPATTAPIPLSPDQSTPVTP